MSKIDRRLFAFQTRTTMNLKYSVGIDVSKDKFDACLAVIDVRQAVTIKATKSFTLKKDYKPFLEWVQKHQKEVLPLCFTMEATGNYFEKLAAFLFENGCFVSVVLPNKAKKYLQSHGIKSKTDKIDAKGLAQMGAEQKLKPWQPFSQNIYKLRSLTRQHESLNKQRTLTMNQLHSQMYNMYEIKEVIKQLKSMIRLIEKQIEQLEAMIKELIEQDLVLNSKAENLLTIPGVGLLTVATVIAETNGFYLIENVGQLMSYVGYDVVENQSGKRVGRTKISKKGNSHIRRILYMPALNVVRLKVCAFQVFYDRLYEKNKIKMKSYVTVQKTILILLYTLWKTNSTFVPGYYQAIHKKEVVPA